MHHEDEDAQSSRLLVRQTEAHSVGLIELPSPHSPDPVATENGKADPWRESDRTQKRPVGLENIVHDRLPPTEKDRGNNRVENLPLIVHVEQCHWPGLVRLGSPGEDIQVQETTGPASPARGG